MIVAALTFVWCPHVGFHDYTVAYVCVCVTGYSTGYFGLTVWQFSLMETNSSFASTQIIIEMTKLQKQQLVHHYPLCVIRSRMAVAARAQCKSRNIHHHKCRGS